MTIDTWLGIGGVIGAAVTIWSFFDARRQRNKREKAVIAAHSVVERTYGLLIGIGPSVAKLGDDYRAAVNDALEAINQRRADLDKL
jgi:hypothetical protein